MELDSDFPLRSFLDIYHPQFCQVSWIIRKPIGKRHHTRSEVEQKLAYARVRHDY